MNKKNRGRRRQFEERDKIMKKTKINNEKKHMKV